MGSFKGKPLQLSLILLLVTCGINGQFEEIEECISDDFIEGLLGCFAAKFDALLPDDLMSASYSNPDGHEYIGRNLLFTHADDVIRQNNMPHVIEKLSKTHESLLGKLASAAHTVKDGMKDDNLVTKLKHMNLKQLFGDYIGHIAMHLRPFAQKATAFKHSLRKHSERLNDMDDAKLTSLAVGPGLRNPLCDFLPDEFCELIKIAECMESYPEEAFEDGLDWLQCLFTCDDLPPLAMCMADLFNETEGCQDLEWIGGIIIRAFVDLVELGHCYFKILSPTLEPNGSISLVEGAAPTYIEVKTYLPPSVLCYEPDLLDNPLSLILDVIGSVFGLGEACDIQIQMSTSNYMYDILPYIDVPILDLLVGRPKCRSDVMIHQAAIGWFEGASDYSCTINVTEENWNDTFRIPIVATVDHKIDGDIDINFTLKMMKDGEIYNTTKIPMTVVDADAASNPTCQSVNDPHLLTFDGHHYNNFYHGYFYLYKHDSMPYEVQAIYQACSDNTTESCNCAIAVRSGDDVLVIDRCRKRQDMCSGDDCQLLKVVLYLNGELTHGTRIFVRNGGLEYQVILPHGTMVRVVTSNDLLNAFIVPSVYDRDNTTGLCGTFNDNVTDDLTMPDGSVYEGDGSDPQGQPRPFNKAWRVPAEERIFSGASPLDTEFEPLKYCKCHHILLEGVQCTCGYEDLVEYCDLDTDGELTPNNVSHIVRRSARHVAKLQGWNILTEEEDRDLDEDYEPADVEWKDGAVWDKATAEAFCLEYIRGSTNDVLTKCRSEVRPDYLSNKAYENCIEDIKITDSTDWSLSALEAGKQDCLVALSRLITFDEAEWDTMENGTCINDCNNNGVCVLGVCECNNGYGGPDCSLEDVTPVMVMSGSSLCDSRYEDCQYATIYGHNFLTNHNLMCHVQEFDIVDGSLLGSDSAEEVGTVYINTNQVACRLPSDTSYQVYLRYDDNFVASSDPHAQDSFVAMAYDSMCYECDTSSFTCKRRDANDYCYIKSGCYAGSQEDPDDHCSICNISVSTDKWTDRTTDECLEIRAEEEDQRKADRQDTIIRASVASSLSVLIVIVAVVVFFIDRRKQKKRQEIVEENSLKPDNDTVYYKTKESIIAKDNVYDNAEDAMKKTEATGIYQKLESDGQTKENQPPVYATMTSQSDGHVNPALDVTDDVVFSDAPTQSNAKVSADVLRVKAEMAAQGRERTASVTSNTSRHSVSSFFRRQNLASESFPERERTISGSSAGHGIGGGGPTHLSHFHASVTDSGDALDMHGIGGHGIPGATPSGKRKDYQNVTIAHL